MLQNNMEFSQYKQIIIRHVEDILGNKLDIASDQSLFSLGFDSMRIMALSSRLRSDGYDVTFADLINNPTLDAWTSLLKDKGKTENLYKNFKVVGEEFPLAPMQYAYWVGSMDGQLLGNVAAHLYVEFEGQNLNIQKFRQSLQKLVNRHDMLRVKVLDNGYQKFSTLLNFDPLVINDLSSLSSLESSSKLEIIRREKSSQTIFKNQKKVFEFTLTLLSHGKFRLHVDIDMLAADAVSYRILLNDLAILYSDYGELPSINYSYRDYVLTKLNNISAHKEIDKRWWNERIKNFPNPLQLPLVNDQNLSESMQSTRLFYWISPENKQKIETFAKNNQVTMAMTLLTAFAEAVGTHSKDKKFFLNLPLFNREQFHPDVDLLVGDFSSSVLVEIDLTNKQTIIERIKSISHFFIESVTHNSYSALDVLRDLSRNRGTTVLAPVVYTSAIGLGELFSEQVTRNFGKPVWLLSQGPQVILDAQITEYERGFLANWDVREGVFLPGVIESIFSIYQENIETIIQSEKNYQKYFKNNVIEEQIKQRNKCNNTLYPVKHHILHQKFYDHAAEQPEKTAIYYQHGDGIKRISYRELANLSLRVASFLVSQGVKPGVKVALSLEKGPQQIIILLGVLASGATYVPIGIKQPQVRKLSILTTSESTFYIVEDSSLTVKADNVRIITSKECFNSIETLSEPITISSESIAYIIFTSGSTGSPKGVEVSHKAVMNTLEVVNYLFSVSRDDISLAFSSLEFDLSIQDIFGLFNVGGSTVVINEDGRYDADYLHQQITQFKVTQLYAVPSMLEMLLSSEQNAVMPSLRLVILGGDKISPELYYQFKRHNPRSRFAGFGGATETAIHCTYYEVKDQLNSYFTCVPYGYPLLNNACRVVDMSGNDCANWTIGELWIGGLGLANGYINLPDKTKEKFVQKDGQTWYRTGDLARYTNDGVVDYIGRCDNQIKLRGYRIEIDEIEGVINRIKEIKNTVVMVIKDRGVNLVAFVQVKENENITPNHIKMYLEKYLPLYMIPERIVVLDKFPLTSNDKIDRKALSDGYVQQNNDKGKTAPKTYLESLLAKKFTDYTGVDCVYLEDDFFQLGGDSVLATQMISSIRQTLDFEKISVSDLFENRTLFSFTQKLKALEEQEGILEKTAEILAELDEI
ncbi:MAG: amino acid adenylation domain-containing protein [Neisseriaceae bacterium]|nr:MAG: amino acid adenylation domain-containing protein [Neisseriaceae bacterium]